MVWFSPPLTFSWCAGNALPTDGRARAGSPQGRSIRPTEVEADGARAVLRPTVAEVRRPVRAVRADREAHQFQRPAGVARPPRRKLSSAPRLMFESYRSTLAVHPSRGKFAVSSWSSSSTALNPPCRWLVLPRAMRDNPVWMVGATLLALSQWQFHVLVGCYQPRNSSYPGAASVGGGVTAVSRVIGGRSSQLGSETVTSRPAAGRRL